MFEGLWRKKEIKERRERDLSVDSVGFDCDFLGLVLVLVSYS